MKVIYGASSIQGYRKKMEDRYMIHVDGEKKFMLFGVFDGHGGSEIAKYCERHFPSVLNENKAFVLNKYEQALKESFIKMDEIFRSEEGRKELLRIAREERDLYNGNQAPSNEEAEQLEIFKSIFDPRTLEECNLAMFTGCTASICLIINGEVYIAHVGNSTTIVVSNDKVVYATKDHMLSLKEEEIRINNANGVIENKRLGGILEISRCLGSLEYKSNTKLKLNKQILIAEPDVKCLNIKEVDYIIIGTDPFWSNKTDTEIIGAIKKSNDTKHYSDVVEEVLDDIYDKDKDKKDDYRKIKDNMTCFIVKILLEAKYDTPGINEGYVTPQEEVTPFNDIIQ